MSARKINRAFRLAGITMPSVIKHITNNIKDGTELEKMTTKQIAYVINIHHKAYHDGRSSAGTEIIDDCILIGDKMIPIAAIKAIRVETRAETHRTTHYNGARGGGSEIVDDAGNPIHPETAARLYESKPDEAKKLWWSRRGCVTRYTLDYTEQV